MTPHPLLLKPHREIMFHARRAHMSIQIVIDRVVEVQETGKQAGVDIQLLRAVDEGAVEMVGPHLAGGVEAVAPVEDAGGGAFAIRFGVDGEFEVVEGRAVGDSELRALVSSCRLHGTWRPQARRRVVGWC